MSSLISPSPARLILLGATAIFACSLLSVAWTKTNRVTYEPSDAILVNPERGFYSQLTAVPEGKAISLDQLLKLREKGRSLILRLYYLDKYRSQDLSEAELSLIKHDFATIRQAGNKCILRFAYCSKIGKPDAPLNVVLRHIEQLRPLLRENADIIATMQAGFIGPWGEWHNSTNNLETDEAVQVIAKQLLDSLPESRCVQIRTPHFKRVIVDSDRPLDANQAFSRNRIARLGHHNDCFLADETDLGTYEANRIDWDKEYLAQDSRYVPVGGETCTPSKFTEVDYARSELERMHWSYMNRGFHPKVLAAWDEAGLLEEAKRLLGYRLLLVSTDCDTSVEKDGSLQISLKLKNSGWAAPFNPRDVILLLIREGQPNEYRAKLPVDPRQWLPGKPFEISCTLGIPIQIVPGKYRLFLKLSDPEPNLSHRSAYSIQLANKGIWMPHNGSHDLRQQVIIKSSTARERYRGHEWFEESHPMKAKAG